MTDNRPLDRPGDFVPSDTVPSDAVPEETPPEIRRRARRMAWLYAAAAALLLPWIVFLAETLPKRQFDRHYRAAWVGFDIILVWAIGRTAYLAFRLDARVQFPATATAVLLLTDAWFDVTTSANHSQFFEALLLAAFVEIPAALFSLYLARSVHRRITELAHVTTPPPGHYWWRIRKKNRRGPAKTDDGPAHRDGFPPD